MTLTPYRETLALRGIRSLLIVATLARIPITAGTVTLTLHVTQDLHLGYGAAGLVGAAFTVGSSLGAPVLGRVTDRKGLRPVLVLTTVAEVTFWTTAQAMPYWALLVAALVGGFLTLPAFAVARQSIAALAPESHRLPAFALDSITTELSFMAGPALGVLISTTAGPRVAMLAVGTGILLSGTGLYLLNPPIRGKDEKPISAGERVPRSTWLKPRLVAVLAITSAATIVLSGTDVAVVAVLQSSGEVEWTGAVLGLWAAYSLLGGFAYGTVKQGLSPLALLAPMALLTIPVGLAGGHWWLLALLLLPAGALCAPTITATADAVSRMTPASARGEAMGLHNSSLTVGVALGAPLAGVVMDTWSPAWGFAAVGGVGVVVAVLALPAELRRRREVSQEADGGVDSEVGQGSGDSLGSGVAGPATEFPAPDAAASDAAAPRR
ncbi:MFS transporter [Actinoplanes sp. NPDC004185]